MDHIVVDVEIARTIDETPGGWNATDKLGVAVVCVWEYTGQRVRVYGPDNLHPLRERLLHADRITGYNIWGFDLPLIWGLSKAQWAEPDLETRSLRAQLLSRTNDLLCRIWTALGSGAHPHKGTKLDDIAGATLGVRKIGNGADAPKWYQAGQVQRVVNYCADDVCLERDLSDFIDRYGYVIKDGKQLFLKDTHSG